MMQEKYENDLKKQAKIIIKKIRDFLNIIITVKILAIQNKSLKASKLNSRKLKNK